MTMAVATARLERDQFSQRRVQMPTEGKKWPRKRFNRTNGIRRDVVTRTVEGKVN
jgi:hypothetical protein